MRFLALTRTRGERWKSYEFDAESMISARLHVLNDGSGRVVFDRRANEIEPIGDRAHYATFGSFVGPSMEARGYDTRFEMMIIRLDGLSNE